MAATQGHGPTRAPDPTATANCRFAARPAPDIRFRPIRPDDADGVIDLATDSRRVDGPADPVVPDELRHLWFDHPGVPLETDSLAALAPDGSLVGAVAVFAREVPTTVGWLGTIGVRRAWRHQGVVSALIARSLASLAAAGVSRVGLDVDADNPTGAVRIYEALGFRPSEESIIYSKPIES